MSELTLVDTLWLVTPASRRLHHATFDPDDLADVEEGDIVCNVTRTCGRRTGWVTLAGLFSRMGSMRCTVCCRRRGLPPGKGAPKNDPECRRILGMDLP